MDKSTEHIVSFSRGETLLHFKQVRKLTEVLCEPLSSEDFVISVTEDTSPPKWHLAHTTWFFENFILKKFLRSYRIYSSEYAYLFNSYYKRVGNFLPKTMRSHISRPTVEEVLTYRRHVNSCLTLLLENADEHLYGQLEPLIIIGINHEQQHQELLLMDIKRNFFANPSGPVYRENLLPDIFKKSASVLRKFEASKVEIGQAFSPRKFTFDNEMGLHHQWLETFALSSDLVTNDEYLAFMEEGGYENPLLWLSDGWDFKEKENWKHPLYWKKEGTSWYHMTLGGFKPLKLSAPLVHVSYYEAQAFAHWKGMRLPTEFEWEFASGVEPVRGDFLEQGSFEPAPAVFNGKNFSQIHGTVWEWTQSAYLPYPGFKPLDHGMGEYNEKFMCNQFVLRGGSSVTPKSHYRPTYRNFYYPHMRWQYAGVRLAKDLL